MLSTQKLKCYYLALLEEEEEELDLEEEVSAYYINNSLRKHRFWLRNHIKYRSVHGEYYTFFQTADEETFENSYRISNSTIYSETELIFPKFYQ